MQPSRFGKIFVTADDPQFLEKEIEPARELFSFGSLNVRELREEYIRRQMNFMTTPFDPEGRTLRLFPSGVTIWSGYPGAGKTTLLRQLVCHLMHKRCGVFVASLEEEPSDVFYRLACTALGTNDPSEDGLQWCIDEWHDRLRLWGGVDTANSAHILAAIRVLAREGVQHAFIDSLMCMDIRNDDWEGQRQFANAMRRTVRSSGAHIHLVAHPRKSISADQLPDINDIAGAREIGGLCDNVLFVRRRGDEAPIGSCTQMQICVRKQRNGTGAFGDIVGWFNRDLKQFKSDQYDSFPTRYLPDAAYSQRAKEEWYP